MNQRLLLILYIIVSFYGSTQNIEGIKKDFFAIEKGKNDTLIIEKGLQVINYYIDNNIKLDTDLITIRLSVALSYWSIGDIDNSLRFNLKTNELISKKWGGNNLYLGISYYRTADVYNELNQPKNSLNYYLLSLEIIEKDRGPGTKLSLNSLAKIVDIYFYNFQDFNLTLKYSLIYLSILEKHKKEIPKELLSKIIICYTKLGETDETNYRHALEFSSRLLGELSENENEIYLRCVENIVLIYCQLKDFESALNQNLLQLELLEDNIDKFPDIYVRGLINAGYISFKLIQFESALVYYEDALLFIDKHKEYDQYKSQILGNISEIYTELGYHSISINYSMKSLNNLKINHPNDSLEIAELYGVLGLNYLNLNNLELAYEFLFTALEIQKKYLKNSDIDIAHSLISLSLVYEKMGMFDYAISGNLEAKRILDETNSSQTELYSIVLNNLATSNISLKNYQEAICYLEKSLETRLYLDDKNGIAIVYNNFANLFNLIGEYNKSIEFSNKALAMRLEDENSILDPLNFYNVSILYENLSFSFTKLGLYDSAFKSCYYSLQSLLDYFNFNRSGLDEISLQTLKSELNRTYQLLCNHISSNYSNIIATSGAHCQINGLIYSNKKNLKEINEKVIIPTKNKGLRNETIETEVSEEGLEIPVNNPFRDITLLDLIQHLKTDEVFVDITKFYTYDFAKNGWIDSVNYIAFIADSQYTLSYYVFIPKPKQLEDDIFIDYQQAISVKNEKNNLQDSIFYNCIWKPIADKIGDAKTIYISSGGIYNNINLNTLYNPETGKYLIEENDIRIVNSARDFVLSKEQEKKQYSTMTSALYGFPDFNGVNTSIDSVDFIASTRDLSYILIDTLTRGGMKASPLPATKIEIEQITTTFQKNGWTVNSFTGDEASETNIKREVSPRVLHIATHGYFFNDIPIDTTENRFLGMDRNRVVEDPMLRSGLLLTGANSTLQGEESHGENGLLSAAEASLLDLRETELVVLSACETGKGEVKNSEGVYGLRKAFADAGAQNIIMSLWKVDDKVTQEFMTRFYEIWLNDKTSIREAFNRTQLEIKAKYPQPYYWGAFILVGE
jgi:CHAT domain-containing protein